MNDIRTRVTTMVAAAAFAAAALAGCAATTDTGSSTAGPVASSSPISATSAALTTASTPLGTIVVDGTGMTVYVFDKDTHGTPTSACTGGCATTWPAVETGSAAPRISGVSGTVGTITGVDGKLQVTLNGLPLYRFAADTTAGETKGQGVGGIWWVVDADGAKVAATGASSTSPSPSSAGHKAGY